MVALVLVLTLAESGLLLPARFGPMSAVQAAPAFQAPTNDDFANALTIFTFPYSNTQNTASATTQAADPVYPCTGGQHYHSVWYAYTATVNGTLHVNTIGSNFDTVLAVWTGAWGSLTNVGCHDDISWPANPQSTLDVSVVSGTTYYIEVVGYYNSSSGTLVLSADLSAPPANDDFDNAFVISATPYTYSQDTSLATTAADDPVFQACGTAGGRVHSHSVWYRFTPSTDGTLHVDTSGSGYDTVLAVWTGSRASLVTAACDDDVSWPSDPTSSVDLDVAAGTAYHIEVVSYGNGSGGSLVLNAALSAPTVTKPLYLHRLASAVTIVDGTSTGEIMDRQTVWGGPVTVTFDSQPAYFYLYPGLQGALTLQGTVVIPLYLNGDTQQNSNVTVSLADLAPSGAMTVIGSAVLSVPANASDWYTFNLSGVSYTVPVGHALCLTLATPNPSRDVTLRYDSATYNSRLELPVTTYVNVEQVSTSSACYPAGSTVFSAGQAMTITARVSDPFGSYDIAGADVQVTDPGGVPVLPNTAMTVVSTTPSDITYEHSYAIAGGAAPGTYVATVTGIESNGVQATGTATFTVQTPVTLSASLAAAPLAVNMGQTVNVTMVVTNSGQAAAQAVAPSPLVLGGTGSATLSSGPIPARSTISGGGMASFAWTYLATAAGLVNWSGNASGTDANSCAAVSAPGTTSNYVTISAVLGTIHFSAGAYSVGESGGSALITVVLDSPVGVPVTVDYATSDSTAQAGSDYTAVANVLTFAPGVTSQTFSVLILPDTLDENDETVLLTLSNPTNATITGTNPATLTIVDDDPLPAVQFGAATYSTGEGSGSASIAVVLSTASGLPITVDYATSDGTAQSGSDYTTVASLLTFAPGVTSQTFAVPILPDALDEEDETVLLTLSNPGNATLGASNPATLTIVDDDPLPSVQFSAATHSVGEGTGPAFVEVTLSTASGRTVWIDYATADGTAQAGSDYLSTANTLTFPPGSTSQSFFVSILDDGTPEGDETVNLSLSNPQNTSLGAPAAAILTIVDDDAAAGQVTIDKGVSPPTVQTPGQAVTYTYTITIYNAGPSRVHVEQITDTLPVGFVYSTTLATAGIRYPDSLSVNGQTVGWAYNTPLPAIGGGAYATLTFQATSSNGSGVYCNDVAVTVAGSIGTVARGNLACVEIAAPVFRIESKAGGMTIVALVRMEPTGPVIISWEFLP
jgi:uncharacterized repeat protein (TIGR01451 family)